MLLTLINILVKFADYLLQLVKYKNYLLILFKICVLEWISLK